MIRLPPERQRTAAGRGQSEVLGVVLLVALVVLGTTVIGLLGAQSMAASRGTAEVAQAEHALSQLDRRASTVALDLEAETAEAPLALGGTDGTLRVRETGWLRVTMVNASTGAVDYEVVNVSPLGRVAYARDDTTVAVEGGGVWRSNRGQSVMLAPPEFHYRNGTLTLPVIATSGDAALTDPVRLERDGPPDRRYPNETAGYGNRLADGKIRVTVQSPYYEAWGRYFDDETNGIVTYDHAARTATVTFLALPKTVHLRSGIIATSGSGEIRLGGNSIYIDSYNSSEGTGRYQDTQSADGSVTAVNDIVATGTSNVQGDLRSGATVDLSGTTTINGTVYWTKAYQQDGASVNGGNESIDGVATIEPIDGHVENVVSSARLSNDNAGVAVISETNELAGSGTLPAGTYYLRNLTVASGETLTLDTSDGDVVVAVEDTVSIVGKGTATDKAARVEVTGNGTAIVYVLGDDAVDLEVGKNGKVAVPDERSRQFRLYSTQDFDGVLTSDQSPAEIRFEGVVYAPAGYGGSGSVVIGQAKFFGALVTGDLTVKQGAEIHYDKGLATVPLPRSPTASRLEYLHVAVHRLSVTS